MIRMRHTGSHHCRYHLLIYKGHAIYQVSDGVVEQVDACLKVLQARLASLYAELLVENGVDLSQGISGQGGRFFDDAINAMGAIGNYGATFFLFS